MAKKKSQQNGAQFLPEDPAEREERAAAAQHMKKDKNKRRLLANLLLLFIVFAILLAAGVLDGIVQRFANIDWGQVGADAKTAIGEIVVIGILGLVVAFAAFGGIFYLWHMYYRK